MSKGKKSKGKKESKETDHILWLNRVFFQELYEDPKGDDSVANQSHQMLNFVRWLNDRDTHHGAGQQDLLVPQFNGYRGLSEEEQEEARYGNALALFIEFTRDKDELCDNEAYYDGESLIEWIACGKAKKQLHDGDIPLLESSITWVLENTQGVEGFKFWKSREEKTLEEGILDNAAGSEDKPEGEIEDVIEDALAKHEEKEMQEELTEEEEPEGEEPDFGPEPEEEPNWHTIYGDEYIPDTNADDAINSAIELAEQEPEREGADIYPPLEADEIWGNTIRTSPGECLVSWAALAKVNDAQGGIEELFKKKPEFDQSLSQAIDQMEEAGILANKRCVLDAILVMLDMDPTQAVKVVNIFEGKTEHGTTITV